MKEFWNARYDTDDFAYGKSPNSFFKEQLWDQKFGRLLLPAEGEGRDAVYAAKKGWLVHAFDYSEVAASKAVVFAHSEGVKFEYQVIDTENFETADEFYHLVSVSFLHLPEKERLNFHRKMVNSLLPGGKIIAEYFSKKQIDKKTGGPQNPELLYSVDDLKHDFSELNILHLTEELVLLENGNYHRDEAWVLRFVGQKPE
jgi:hypothetical protein